MDFEEVADSATSIVSKKLPPVPNYPAPLPPSLKEAPVWDGPEPESDSEDEESTIESADYEEVTHEPLTEAQAQESLNEVVRLTNFVQIPFVVYLLTLRLSFKETCYW